jgi:hypothetical protein
MKLYCLHCNHGNDYNSSRPNFCGKCGKPFIDSSIASKPNQYQDLISISQPSNTQIEQNKQKGKLNRGHNDEEEFDYPEDATSVPQLDKIECELTVSNLRPNRESGRDVFNNGSLGEAREVLGKRTVKTKKVSKIEQNRQKQEFQEQFKNQLARKSRSERDSVEISG